MAELVIKGISEELKGTFKKVCKDNGSSMSELLIRVIQQVTGQSASDDESRDGNREKKITLRLSESELEALLKRQEDENDPFRTITAVNALRQGLGLRPIMNNELVETVRGSNRELSAIGRNLNQVARVLNTDPQYSESLRHEAIMELVATIEDHRARVSEVIKNSVGRSI